MLPNSFANDGFTSISQPHKGFKRLMIGSDGWPNTGKTEFGWSLPEPIMTIVLDRGYEAALDNPTPPETRGKDIAVRVIQAPLASQASQGEYLKYWKDFYAVYTTALSNADVRSVIIDGDSDSWELQRLAEFGRLEQVPPHRYASVNAARRAMYARAWDSGKVVLFTNKLKEGYESKVDKDGKEVRTKTGKEERQGFSDQEYLFQIQLRHLYDEEQGIWGVRIEMCKANTQLKGLELWGEECNFKSLVQNVYPQYSLQEWGYK